MLITRQGASSLLPAILLLFFCCFTASGQISGTQYVPGNYATIAAAVSALNTSGVGSGGVTINIAAGYTETISATISLTATGTAANPIVFQKDPATSGSNPLITAYTGGVGTPATAVQDGIFRLVGSDYVTIDGINLAENSGNTTNPATMEYGYALYKASTSNGCQNVTIKNCSITLSNVNNAAGTAPMVDGSAGIIVMNALATAATTNVTPIAGGTNSNNKFYSNTIQNCNTGIALIGYAAASPFTLADANNDIGGSTYATANSIINFGGASGAVNAAVGIRTLAQYGLNVSNNIVNSNNGWGANHPTTLRGIYINAAMSATATISNNTVTVTGGGTTQNITGIENASGSTAASNTITISGNTITNSTYATATTGGFYAINNSGSPTTLLITGNTISSNSSAATTTGFFYGIYNSGIAGSVAINSNTLSTNSTAALTTGLFCGIYNAAAAPAVTIKRNTFSGNATTATTGVHFPIYNTGAATTTLNLDSNSLGTISGSAFTFNAANSAAQIFINNTGGTSTCALSITGNTFRNVNYAVAGTGANTYISNTATTLSQTINGNVFTNLNVNTTGSITFIANSVAVPATGTQNVNSNSISGTFTKAAGGTLTLFTNAASSVSGSVINNSNNNFSNITVTGATIIAGWVNTDAGSPTKTISGNTFSNWSGGTGAINAMNINITGAGNATTGNLINNITCACTLVGITTAAGNDNIYGNTINTLTTTGLLNVAGILVTSGTTKNVYGNKIYDLQASTNGGSAYGISVTGTTSAVVTANIHNNLIGDLRAPTANSTSDLVRGISITSTRASSTINVYYNTIYLNAVSSGTNFSTTGLYHTVSATATTAALNLRNNIIANFSTPNGSGLTVAYRRSSTSFANYASTSNNNLFFAGAASATRLLFYNGTNSDQTIVAYRARVTPMDAQSVTEDLSANFLSTSGASANFLHLNASIATQAESGGANISGYATDYDAATRQGNAGYAGTGTAPDIGADEFSGIKALPLSGTYTVGTGGNYPSLTQNGGLFADINSLGLSGDVVVNIISDLTEDGANSLNAWEEQGVGNYTLTIQPNSTTPRLISGSVAGPLIKLTGARRVTVDGRFSGSGNYLTFRNTNTAGTVGTALTFINGATNNTIQYCGLEAYANSTNGVVLFSTSTLTGGNSNNQISNCNINATVGSNSGSVGIYSAGTSTAGFENSSNIISNNNIYNFRDKGIEITATGTTGWTISGNSLYNGDVSNVTAYAAATSLYGIRILGGAGYSILNNYIGGSLASAGGTTATYASTAGLLSYWGILLTTSSATPASNIKGNTLANIAVSAVPTATSANMFMGIETNGSGINIGGSLAGEGNIIGSTSANSSIVLSTTTAVATYKTTLRGINCASTGGQIIGNKIGGIDIKNIGAAPGASTFSGIYASHVTPPSQINSNVVGGSATNSIRVLSTSTCVATLVYGVNLASTITGTVQVDANTVQNIGHLSTANTTGSLIAIASAAAGTAAVSITNNAISANYIAANTTGGLYGINTTGAAASVTISGNTITGSSFGAAAGIYSAILNSGAVTGTLTINGNYIGTASNPALTSNVASTGTQVFISNTAGAATAALSISNNNIQNIVYNTASSGANTYISNTAATLSQAINGNTFTNLNVNTSGSITFIANSVVVGATGTQNVNNNAISGTFTKRAGGTLTLFSSAATSVAGGVVNNNSNNFSNITVTGATTIAGWTNIDAGAATKTIQNNTFSNWSCGSSAVTAMSVNLSNSGNATTGNLINNISGSGAITGIATAAGNDNIYSNTINSLSSTGSVAVTGISVTAGTTKNIYRNKIYDLAASGATGSVNGILIFGSTVVTVNIYNNVIGDLRAPAGNSTTDLVRAISLTQTTVNSAANVYFNTIYLNASSTGTNFSTTGIYHTASATATTATLTLRNNSVTNTSTPKGTGNTVAYRRSANALGNFASASNNNLFYAGTPGTTKLIFTDGTNSDQTLANYKSRVTPRETASVTEDLTAKFLSTTGSSSVFLHMNSTISSLVESGAVNISGITDDYDGQVRQGNTGYSGSGYAPDIGADEVFGIESIPPAISYTLLTNTTSTTNRTFSGVAITDGSGVNITAGTKPRVYYKRYRDANTYADNTSSTNGWKFTEATNSSSPFSFTIDYSLLYGGSSVTVGEIQYFVVAQDLATIANIGINSGTFNTAPTSVALTAAAFPIGGTINSFDIPFSGTYNVGSSEVFTSLTKADGLFGSINRVGLMGNTIIRITSDLSEDGFYALNQWTETGAGNYRLTIQPDAPSARIISGDVVSGLIRLDGVDRLTIDGSSGGSGQYLTFRNTNAAGTTGTAFTLINGASADTVRYCNLEAYADATHGVVLFNTSATTGNSNDVIDNCNINATVNSNTGSIGIYSAGSVGFENSSNTVSNNNIYDYRDRGLDITATGSSAWTVSGNSFYNGNVSSSINYAASTALHGIRILGGSGYSILNNYIGGNASLASGSNASYASTLGNVSFGGILLTTSSATPASAIKGNQIAKITVSSVPSAAGALAFSGIETGNAGVTIGGTGSGEGNLIGSNTVNGSISITTTTSSSANTSLIYGINCGSTGGSIVANQVGGIDIINSGTSPAPSAFQGIYINGATAPTPVKGNTVGSFGTGAASNSVRVRAASTALTTSMFGIAIGSSVTSSVLLDSNFIQNVRQGSTTSSGSFTGISDGAASTASLTISNNSIKNISGAANAHSSSTLFTAIDATSPATISNNTIDNISIPATGTAVQIRGISTSGNFIFTISGNTIANLTTPSTKTGDIELGLPSTYNIVGILSTSPASGLTISANNLHNFSSTTTTTINTAVAGIGLENGAGNVYNNRISIFTNTATGSATLPGMGGITIAGGTFNVYNNVVSLDNSFNANGLKIYGITHGSSGNCNYYYNTVSIGGSATGTAARSAAFVRTGSSTLLLRNNVLLNSRTGTGSNYGISNIVSPASAFWSASTSDYNNIYSATPATVAEWGAGVNNTFAQWITVSGGGGHSFSRAAVFLTSTYDLEPSGISNCALDNNAVPVSSPIAITTDINGITRNSSTPDMGAYEFSYSYFSVSASNNSPVCAGDNVSLSSDPGNAINPTYSWTNPSNAVVSVTQNPTVLAVGGKFKVIVTDVAGCTGSDSTIVTIRARPTASISGATSVCDGSSLTVNVTVTGSGTISGMLSSGDAFSGSASTIGLILTPAATTSYYVTSLSDANCTSIFPTDAPDTLTVIVRQAGLWSGAISTSWNVAGNWLCGVAPDPGTDITVPSGVSRYPVLSSGTVDIGDLLVQSGASITISGSATLQIEGAITGSGSITATSGTIEMKGSAAQTLPGNMFSSKTLKNLTINNTAGVAIADTIKVSGIVLAASGTLNAAGRLTLLSTATATALVDGSGAGNVTGNVTMQRYLPSGYGYRYLSSPFQAATVAEFSNDINLAASFSPIYRYDENLTSAGWVNYSNATGTLNPLEGYAVNCGASSAVKTIDLRGVVNNGTITSPTLYNHHYTYTLGFNLAGNPYPSPIDWNSVTGWTKTNIDNAIYYFNASSTNQYTGAYSTYINGVSSDGIASNIIPSMQAFFVHVSNGSYPVSGSLSVNNAARVTTANPAFHKQAGSSQQTLVRISAAFESDTSHADYTACYFDVNAKPGYESGEDALKLNNTDERLPNIYAVSSDAMKLSITGLPEITDDDVMVPLGITTAKDGWTILKPALINYLPAGMRVYLADAQEHQISELQTMPAYRAYVQKGGTDDRFYLIFSRNASVSIPGAQEALKAYYADDHLNVYLREEAGTVRIVNALGQTIKTEAISGKGFHQIPLMADAGVYLVSLYTSAGQVTGKVLVQQ